MSDVGRLIKQSRDLKETIIREKRIRREKRMKELKKIKDEYAERNTPKEQFNKPLETQLEPQEDIDSNIENNEVMDNIRNSIQELKQQKLDR